MVQAYTSELLLALKSAGLKLTPQRLAIVECLVGDQTHPTAQELFDRLRARFPSMSVATVYNTLGALTAIGGLRPLEMGGATRFDPNTEPHHHAVCESCGSIRDVSGAAGQGQVARCTLPGFVVRRVEHIYRGLCAQCSARAQAKTSA
jgi:Fur family peroxide stress response transcriptional regulator